MLPFHLVFLQWLFPSSAVQLGPNSGAADAASGVGKAGCRNGQNQELLRAAKWLWQPDLSVESYSCGAGGLGLMGRCSLLPRQPLAVVAVTKCAQTSQRQQKQQLWAPPSPAVCLSAAHVFPIPREPRHTPKGFGNSESILQASAFAWSRLLTLILQAFLLYCLQLTIFLFIFIFISHSVLKWCERNICSDK